MKKDQPSQSLPELDVLEENHVLNWLQKNGQNVAYFFAGLIGAVILGYWFFSHRTATIEKEYYIAENAIVKMQLPQVTEQDKVASKQAYEKLSQIVNANTDLQAKYDGIIAETLLQQGNVQEALPYANRSLERVKVDNLPFYQDFARNALLIAQGQYDQALKQSLQLQAQMQVQAKETDDQNLPRTFGDSLYAMNLIRIAMLQQQAGLKADELKTWDQLNQALNGKSNIIKDLNALNSVISHMDDTGVSLSNYIDSRKLKQ